MVAAYPVGAVFLATNWHLPGMPLVTLGAALNLLAISVNDGVMPASPSALAEAGLGVDEPASRTRPPWPSPGWRSWATSSTFLLPLSNVFSIGDVLIALGVVWALHRICRSRLAPSRHHS
jgi:Family of unknown function (DUF5317)